MKIIEPLMDMPLKENSGTDPIRLRQGYKVLEDAAPDRCRDEQLSSSQNLQETADGGFLGRTVAVDSESSEL